MPLDLGYQAGEGRGQGPARSFPEASSSLLSCSGNLHNKGGGALYYQSFGCVYFETVLDDGPGSKGVGLESTWMLSQRWLAPPCRSSDLEEALRLLRFTGIVSAHLLYVPSWPLLTVTLIFSTLMRM